MNPFWIETRIARRFEEAKGICSFELEAMDGFSLPAFDAGAHVDVEVRPGLVRQYSLCGPPSERARYAIAVLDAPDSRGGSRGMHGLEEGALVRISAPRNHFPLAANAEESVLVAGGIGITPILCMAERLAQAGLELRLHYAARSRERAAFVKRIEQSSYSDHVRFYFDDEGARIDLEAITAAPSPRRHLYVCGPSSLMSAVLEVARARGWAEGNLHREVFTAARSTSSSNSFHVRIASTGQVLSVPENRSVLEVLVDAGIEIPTSCEQGACGTCLTRVLEGTPDHRDSFMTAAEHAANDQFTPCCSRSKTPLLVLDL